MNSEELAELHKFLADHYTLLAALEARVLRLQMAAEEQKKVEARIGEVTKIIADKESALPIKPVPRPLPFEALPV